MSPERTARRLLSTYEKLRFVRDRRIGKRRWVVTKLVERPA